MIELTAVTASWMGVIWKDWPKDMVASSTWPTYFLFYA
jgi:hypothetical protein